MSLKDHPFFQQKAAIPSVNDLTTIILTLGFTRYIWPYFSDLMLNLVGQTSRITPFVALLLFLATCLPILLFALWTSRILNRLVPKTSFPLFSVPRKEEKETGY